MSTHTPETTNPPVPTQPPEPVPPLRHGDRLTLAEFERRYDAMPDLKKAELIEGVVHMPSPVAFGHHSNPHFNLITWLGQYCTFTPGVMGGDNGTLRLDVENDHQPDAFLLVHPSHGGRARISPDDYVEGGPELVAEVAASSAAHDLNVKLPVYRRNGVQEYVAWRVFAQAIDWFVLRGSQYERLPLSPASLYQSEVLPGLWLDPAALVRGDLIRVAKVVQQGVASPEHAAFVQRLQQAAARHSP
jgi:hypothetical protein